MDINRERTTTAPPSVGRTVAQPITVGLQRKPVPTVLVPLVPLCRVQFGGLGQLCDGVLGGDDFIQTKELRVWPGYDYLGWSREALGQGSVDIEFHFEKPRVFHSMQVGGGGGLGEGGVIRQDVGVLSGV